MNTQHVRIETYVVLKKTLPSWLRGHGYMVLVGNFVDGWQGPADMPGWKLLCGATFHCDCANLDDASSLWFLLPEGAYEFFSSDRLLEAAAYIMERLPRRAHQPRERFVHLGLFGPAPGLN